MTREEFGKYKSRELARMLSDKGIKGAWEMKKADIVEKLLEFETITNECMPIAEVLEPLSEQVGSETKLDNEHKDDGNCNVFDVNYIESATIGTIVAFKLGNKTKSAMIVKKSTTGRKFLLETAYGVSYVVPYEDIVWVKTGRRWPRGVYMALKGLQE